MKRVHRIGLVTAGKITGLWIEKTLELKRNVGPVYSTSLRLASRASNTLLRTGFHTTDWEELYRCEAVLFFLPAKSLRLMVDEWIRDGRDLRGFRFVLCDPDLSLTDLDPVRHLGALTASLGPLPHHDPHRFVGEGDVAALAPVIRLLEADGLKFNRLNTGGKQQLALAVDQLQTDTLPLFARSVETLRESGLTHEVAVALSEKCLSQMLRLYARNGRRIWEARGGPALREPIPDSLPPCTSGADLLVLEGALVREREEGKAAIGAAAGAFSERDDSVHSPS